MFPSKAEHWRIDALELWCWRTLESPLDCKEFNPINSKGNRSWIFIRRSDAEAPILWPSDAKSWLIRKDPDGGKVWRQEEKGLTEDEIVEWYHWLNWHEFEHAPGDGEGQGNLACCSPWGRKSQTRLSDWTPPPRGDFPGGPVAKIPRSRCRGLGSVPGQGTRSHMLQLKDPYYATKVPKATTKTGRNLTKSIFKQIKVPRDSNRQQDWVPTAPGSLLNVWVPPWLPKVVVRRAKSQSWVRILTTINGASLSKLHNLSKPVSHFVD